MALCFQLALVCIQSSSSSSGSRHPVAGLVGLLRNEGISHPSAIAQGSCSTAYQQQLAAAWKANMQWDLQQQARSTNTAVALLEWLQQQQPGQHLLNLACQF
jgi:hypothetical protein